MNLFTGEGNGGGCGGSEMEVVNLEKIEVDIKKRDHLQGRKKIRYSIQR